MNDTADAVPRPSLVNPSWLHERAREDRARIKASLEALNGRRVTASDLRKRKLAEIERLQREVALLDEALADVDRKREEALAMDDALAEEMRALERVIARRVAR